MRKRIMTFAMVTAMVTFMATGSISSNAVSASAAKVQDTNKENYIIVCSDDAEAEQVIEENESIFVASENKIDEGTLSVSLSADEVSDLEEEYEEIQVEKDELVSGCSVKTKEEVDEDDTEWNLKMINAQGNKNTAGKHKVKKNQKVKVAIIDSGVDYSEDIDVVKRKNFIPGEDEVSVLYEDGSGHGTSVAGIIAAKDNDLGITGINENVELYSAKVLDESNVAPISRIIEAINWAIDEKVNIINMSFGTTTNSQALYNAIKKANDAGILLIASAGNDGIIEYPAKYEEVIAVGSVNAEGELSERSATGEELEVVAPGEQILSTSAFDGVMACGGTSMSAPHVTGVASVLWQKNMNMPADFIRKLLRSTVKDMGNEEEYGYGVIDLNKALEEYENAKKEYKREPQKATIDVRSNEENLATYDDVDYVEGRWGGKNHGDFVLNSNTNGLTANNIQVLKRGAKLPDMDNYGLNFKWNNPQWHGFEGGEQSDTNYFACYILATRMGKKYASGSYSDPPCVNNMLQSDYKKMCREIGGGINGHSWSDVMGTVGDVTSKNKSLILYGMAIHIATDTYVHSCCCNGFFYGDKDTPNEPYDNRYECSQAIAKKIVRRAVNATEGTVEDFIRPEYDGSFKIYRFKEKIGVINPNVINNNLPYANRIDQPKFYYEKHCI